MIRSGMWIVGVFSVLLAAGCGSGVNRSQEELKKMAGGKLKEVVPVSGKVLVDGVAEAGVIISVFGTSDGKQVTQQTRTDSKGNYCWTTYIACDGLEPLEYKACFKFVRDASRNGKGDDVFKGKYSNPTKSEFSFKVEKGPPMKDLNFELTTASDAKKK